MRVSILAFVIVVAVCLSLVAPSIYHFGDFNSPNNKVTKAPVVQNYQSSTSQSYRTSAIGFILSTLVLSNNSIIPGNYVQRTNNSSQPHFMAYDPENGCLYVTLSNSSSVDVISSETSKVIKQIKVGTNPKGIAIDPLNGNIFVANYGNDTVSIISWANNSVIRTVSAGSHPFDIAYSPMDHSMYVTDRGILSSIGATSGNVTIISTDTYNVSSTLKVGKNPTGIAYDPANGEMYIACYHSSEVLAINVSSGAKWVLPAGWDYYIGWPYGLEYNPANKCMYISDDSSGNVFIVNASNKIVATSMQGSVGEMTFNPLNGYMYVVNSLRGMASYGFVTALNSSTYAIAGRLAISGWHVGAYGDAFASAYDPANEFMYVTSSQSDTISIIQINGPLTVNFTEKGLKPGMEWTITFNGVTESSQDRVIQFNTLPGNFSYTISSVNGYFTDSLIHRNITVNAPITKIGVSFILYSFMEYATGVAIVAAIAVSFLVAYIVIRRRDRGPP